MKIRIVTFGGERLSRGRTIALAVAALAVGGIFVALGVALLATLTVIGTVVAGGMAVARAIRGRRPPAMSDPTLDPSMEVFPPDSSEARRLQGRSETR